MQLNLINVLDIIIVVGNFTIPTRVSPQVVFHSIPNKLVLEISSEGEYDNIAWSRNGTALGTSVTVQLSEFVNFFEIFVREPTSISDHGFYDITYFGAGGIGTEIAVVSPGKLMFSLDNYFKQGANYWYLVSPTTTGEVENLPVIEGGSINISCYSIGGPVPCIIWTINNHIAGFSQTDIIKEASSLVDVVTIGNINSTLHIVDAQYPTHDGVYTCTGMNTASHNTSSMNISIMVKGNSSMASIVC